MDIEQKKEAIRQLLRENSDTKIAEGMGAYFKHVLPCHGIKVPKLKEIFKVIKKEVLADLTVEEEITLAYGMFESDYAEEKRLATDILIKNLKHLNRDHLNDFVGIIDNHIYDWSTCDGLSGKVISVMIKKDETLAELVRPWKDAECLWRQRAACIVFVKLARLGQFDDLIIDIVSSCVKNSERFVQLGVGWVLRELSLADLDRVCEWIKRNYSLLSREGLRYAIEKMDTKLKKELMEYDRER